MPVVMMTMAEVTVARMTMTHSVMPVATTVPAVATVPATVPAAVATACEGFTGDGQGSGGQRESGNRCGKDRLELGHGSLLGWAGRGPPCDAPS
jgi:hypothetical protein